MHAKSKITGILPKGFKAQKCKTSLKMAVSRIKLLKNKKEVSVKQLRRELAHLLETGQEQTARIRVEHVIREEKTMSAYDLIEVYCELIAARLPIIESQKSCPVDLKEAISSVIFAAPRCSDIQELPDIRKHFTAKYGKEFVTAALEVRPECGVNRMMVEKLSAKAPDVELKIKVLKDVAAEHNINWEPKQFEDIQNPKEGLLNGPASFTSGNIVKAEPSNLQSSSAHIWEDEPSRKVSENFVSTKPTSYNIPHISGSSRSSEEKMSGDDEVRQAYSKESPLSWSTKYKDAASAAEDAAESAERASIAARAAAELASRERISRQHSADSYTMPANTAKNRGSGSQKNSKLETSSITSESTNLEDDNKRSTSITKTAIQKQVKVDQATKRSELDSRHSTSEIVAAEKTHHIDSSFRESISENELQEDDWELYDNDTQMGFTGTGAAVKDFQQKKEDYNQMPDNLNKKSNASLFRESMSKDELQEDDWELYDKPQKGFKDAGAAGRDFQQKNDDGNQMPDNLNKKSKESAPTYDGYSMWDDHESTTIHISEVAFDRSDSDTDDHSFRGSYAKENLFDSVLRQKEQPSYLSADIYSSRTEQHTRESLFNQSSSQMHFVAEDQDSHSAKRIFKDELPSQVKDSTQPSYDSYGPSSESEDDIEAKQPIPLHSQSIYEKSSSSVISGRKSASMHEKTEVVEDAWSLQPVVSPGVKDTHLEVESSSLEKSRRRPGLNMRYSQQTQISGRSPRSLDSRGGLTEEVTSDSGTSEESYENGGLSLGNIIPGSRNKHDNQPPYIGNSAVNVYPRQGITSSDDSQQKKKGMISDVAEIPTSRVTLKEKATKELHAKDYTPKSSSLRSYEAAYFVKNKPSRNTIMDETSNFGGPTASGMSVEDTTHYGKMPEDEDDPVQAYLQQRRKKQQKEVTYQSSSRNIMSDDFEEHSYSVAHGHHGNRTSIPKKQDAGTSASTDHRRSSTSSSKVPVAEMYDKKPHIRSFDESSSNMMMRCSNLDDKDAGQSESAYTLAKSVDNNVKLSRRTKPMASDIKEKSSVRTTRSTSTESPIEKETRSSQRQSAFESFPIEAKQSRELDAKVQPNHKYQYLSDDEPSIKNLNVESSTRKGISKSSQQEKIDDGSSTPSPSGKTTSREGSLKDASHTHPKLPDYESLAAHFQSLRANVRGK